MKQGSVVVVGGGVIGALSAYYLANSGWGVTIIDRGRFGQGCSHGNCGYICPSHVLPLAMPGAIRNTLRTFLQSNSPLKIHPRAVINHLGWFWKFARRCNHEQMMQSAVGIHSLLQLSRQLYDEVRTAEKLDIEWDTSGLLFVFQTQKAFEHYAEFDELLRNHFNVRATAWDAKTLESKEPALQPGAAAGAWHYAGDAQLRPDRFMTQLRDLLKGLGVRIIEEANLQGMKYDGTTAISAVTSAGEYNADKYLIATGAWTPQLDALLGTRLPIIPGKGYSLTMPRPALCPTYPMIFEE
ncbi:MAG: NAD(P)/FAD-dependent oxidoreductase, partial [Gemmataceae bacterium]